MQSITFRMFIFAVLIVVIDAAVVLASISMLLTAFKSAVESQLASTSREKQTKDIK